MNQCIECGTHEEWMEFEPFINKPVLCNACIDKINLMLEAKYLINKI